MNINIEKNLYNIHRILGAYLGIGKDMTKDQLKAISDAIKIMATNDPTGNTSMMADLALGKGCFGVNGLR